MRRIDDGSGVEKYPCYTDLHGKDIYCNDASKMLARTKQGAPRLRSRAPAPCASYYVAVLYRGEVTMQTNRANCTGKVANW